MQAVICDDNKQDQFQMRRILESGGYDVIEAFEDGRSLIAWLEENPARANLIVLDLIMPVLDGYAAFFEMIEKKMNYRIIVASVENSKDVISNLLQHGVMNFISKPFDRSMVLEKVNAVMQRPVPQLGANS